MRKGKLQRYLIYICRCNEDKEIRIDPYIHQGKPAKCKICGNKNLEFKGREYR